jgi:hypothetical protein
MGGGRGLGGDFLAKLIGQLQENTGTDTQREEGSDGKKNNNQELSCDDCIGNVALWLQVILLINSFHLVTQLPMKRSSSIGMSLNGDILRNAKRAALGLQ